MRTPISFSSRSRAILFAALACTACSPQVREYRRADVIVPCWGDAPLRMRHVDWALGQSGLTLNRADRERLLASAQRVCAAGAAYADFVLQPGSPQARDGLLTRAGVL